MTAGIVTVGRREYAAGLYWENSPGESVSQAAREAARQSSQAIPFFAVRPSNKNGRIPQFGLGPENCGLRVGLPCLAACLANQQPGSWAGAFRLREGTVVIIIRDDLLLPDGDLFFQDESEARARLLQEIGFGGLQRVYAPESWSVAGADSLPLGLLLNDRSDVRLVAVEISRRMVVGGAAAAVGLIAVLIAGWQYSVESERQETERLAQVQSIEKAKATAQSKIPQALVSAPVTYPPPEKYWEQKPRPEDFVEACRSTLAKVPVALAGWSLTNVKCEGGSLNVSWTRTSGPAAQMDNMTVNENGMNAAKSFPLPEIKPRGVEDLITVAEVTRRILSQNWNVSGLKREPGDPPPPPPPNYQGAWSPPAPPWVKRSFTLTAPVLPWMMSTYFSEMPGVIVNSMSLSLNGTNGQWSIDGVIYENLR